MSAGADQRGASPAHATGAVEFVPVDAIAPDETFRLRPDGDVAQLATSLGRLGQLEPVELRPWAGAGADADGPRWQVVSGFRRLAAMRMLARDRVLARLHRELSDQDAWGLALSEALLHEPLTGDELETLRDRLRAAGVAPWAEELVDEALVRAPVPAALRERFFDFLTGEPAPAAPLSGDEGMDGREDTPTLTPPSPSQGEGGGRAPTLTPPSPFQGEGETLPAVLQGEGEEQVEVTPEELAADLVARLSALNQDLAIAAEAWDDLPVEGRRALLEQARYVAELWPFLDAKG